MPAPSTSRRSRCTTTARTSSSGSRPATWTSAARSERNSSTSTCMIRARPSTSTAAANASRNFQIASAFAWSRLIQVQGFGQRYEDASGATARHGHDQRQLDLAVHHRARAEGDARPTRLRLGIHGRVDRSGRVQLRPGARFPADPAAVPVRRLRRRRAPIRTARRPLARCRSLIDVSPRRSDAVRRARLHAPRTRCLVRRHHPVSVRTMNGTSGHVEAVEAEASERSASSPWRSSETSRDRTGTASA